MGTCEADGLPTIRQRAAEELRGEGVVIKNRQQVTQRAQEIRRRPIPEVPYYGYGAEIIRLTTDKE